MYVLDTKENKVLQIKSYFQCFKILFKMSVRFDIDRACN